MHTYDTPIHVFLLFISRMCFCCCWFVFCFLPPQNSCTRSCKQCAECRENASKLNLIIIVFAHDNFSRRAVTRPDVCAIYRASSQIKLSQRRQNVGKTIHLLHSFSIDARIEYRHTKCKYIHAEPEKKRP